MSLHLEPDNAPVVSDATLEHWGKVYLDNPWIRARGILFETFLKYPHDILGTLPAPLPVQIEVRRRLDAEHFGASHRSELLARHVEAMFEHRRVHVTDGRIVETMHRCSTKPAVRARHNPWRLGGSR